MCYSVLNHCVYRLYTTYEKKFGGVAFFICL